MPSSGLIGNVFIKAWRPKPLDCDEWAPRPRPGTARPSIIDHVLYEVIYHARVPRVGVFACERVSAGPRATVMAGRQALPAHMFPPIPCDDS